MKIQMLDNHNFEGMMKQYNIVRNLTLKLHGSKTSHFAQVLLDMGDGLAEFKKFEEAAPLLREAMDIYRIDQGIDVRISYIIFLY